MQQTAIWTFLGLALVFAVAPLLWGLVTSFKSVQEISAWPPSFVPRDVTWDNYRVVLTDEKLIRYFLNTFVVIGVALVLSSGLAMHAAYAASRFRFRGKSPLMLLIWSTIMVPGVAVIVPQYLIAVEVGIYDTLLVLVLVYSAWLVPTLVWLFRGFLDAIPRELEEAALIDG
ncbi:MAG: carbohydrate ABC transporter permease, partial [Pirellulales bacterium]|nr:carbohydrate ABC transporter permease [Pirellulales bacterium]